VKISYGNKWKHDFDRIIIDHLTKEQERLDIKKPEPKNLMNFTFRYSCLPVYTVYFLNNDKPYWNWCHPQNDLISAVLKVYAKASPNAILGHLDRMAKERKIIKYPIWRKGRSFHRFYSLPLRRTKLS